MTWYLDTSAFLKLVVAEPESDAVRAWWAEHGDAVVSSDLLRTEALRVTRRVSPEAMAAARHLLDAVPLLRLDPVLCDQAGTVGPPELRSLDALHLAAATSLGEELDGVVTYDERVAAATRALGVPVTAPT